MPPCQRHHLHLCRRRHSQAAELGKATYHMIRLRVQGAASAFKCLTKLDEARLTANVGQCSPPTVSKTYNLIDN